MRQVRQTVIRVVAEWLTSLVRTQVNIWQALMRQVCLSVLCPLPVWLAQVALSMAGMLPASLFVLWRGLVGRRYGLLLLAQQVSL